jgi:hypothetical protein
MPVPECSRGSVQQFARDGARVKSLELDLTELRPCAETFPDPKYGLRRLLRL